MYRSNHLCIDESLHVLLVDDEPQTLLGFGTLLKSAGVKHVSSLTDSREVLPFIERYKNMKPQVSVAVLDLSMPHIPGQDLLLEIKEQYPDIILIVMTATNDIDTAVECMKNGAIDYLVKPVEANRFVSSVQRAMEIRQLKAEVSSLKAHILSDKLEKPEAFSHIVTRSPQLFSIFKYIEAISHSPQPVVITGETGVGKELIARALHLRRCPQKEFVAINVAGLDDTMFSDTLFGHKKGAFTGADSQRDGLIMRAAGGTVFLDEIGDMNLQSQVKLLRLIQENEYYQLGADIPRKTDAHIIVATNQDLSTLIKNNLFRKDLYYRLCSHHVHVPPLRERKDDIPILLDYFINKASHTISKKMPSYPPQLASLLMSYDFPGNIRELESLVYDSVSRHQSGVLSMESFKNVIQTEITSLNNNIVSPGTGYTPLEKIFNRFPTLKQMEEYMLNEAMKKASGNQGVAASYLGI